MKLARVAALAALCSLQILPFAMVGVARAGTVAGNERATTVAAPSDFNGDGYGDLAVAVPLEDVGSATDTGAVSTIYGSADGLSSTINQWFDQTSTGSATDVAYDYFGWATAAGDFNGDGFADLAVGVPFKEVGLTGDAGAVSVLYGSPTGLRAANSHLWDQNQLGTDPAEVGDGFGAAVATGDINGDEFADLAVGVPGEGIETHAGAGAVNVLYGSPAGLSAAGTQFWSQASTDINGKAETGDNFGLSVAIGDFDGDGFGDLASGIPLEDLSNGADAGSVSVINGSAAGLTATNDQLWDQDSEGISNKVEKNDWFGYSVGVGDFDADGFTDLIAGVPFENFSNGSDAGGANVIYGTSGGLTSTGDQFWDQDSTNINDKVEQDDNFAFAVSAGDFNGDGFDDAVFGVPGEDLTDAIDGGAVNVIYGSSAGLDDPGDQVWKQSSSGIEDSPEPGDIFGVAVTAVDLGKGPQVDLAVGVQWEDVGTTFDAGAVNVIYGSASDLTDAGNQFWTQNSSGIVDQAEEGDVFGWGLGEPGSGTAPPGGQGHAFAFRWGS